MLRNFLGNCFYQGLLTYANYIFCQEELQEMSIIIKKAVEKNLPKWPKKLKRRNILFIFI